MRFLRLIFPIYLRRLRWEIAGWWLLSGSLSLLFLTGRAVESLFGLSQAEVVVALWMTLRLALIDDAFGTLAGRHWRPLRKREILVARLLLVLFTFLPPLLLRLAAWQRWAMPEAGMWRGYLLDTALPPLLFLLLAGMGIQLASFLNRWVFKRGRKATAIIMAVLAGWLLLRTVGQSYRSSYRGESYFADQNDFNRDDAIHGIRGLLPPDALLLGDWRDSSTPNSYLPMREWLRIPLREGRIAIEPGVEAMISKPELKKGDLHFEVRFRCRDRETAKRFRMIAGVAHYRDGHYSDLSFGGGNTLLSTVALLPVWDVLFKGRAVTPGVLPWRDAGPDAGTEGAELIFYMRDQSAPKGILAEEPDPCMREIRQGDPVQLPAIARKYGYHSSIEGKFDLYSVVPDEPGTSIEDKVRGCVLLIGADKETDPKIVEVALALGRAAIPPLLARPTWPDLAWEKIIRPLLLANATLEDRAALLERLKTEPRLSAVFAAKGWTAEALPLLRVRAMEGLPLDEDSLKLLAAAKEPGFAATLMQAALRSDPSSKELDALLKAFPGFDWHDYALEAWRRGKYRRYSGVSILLPAARAAREGDISALRHLAEYAVFEEPGYAEQLRALVAGEPQDVVTRVKENFAAMRFDPTSGKWVLP